MIVFQDSRIIQLSKSTTIDVLFCLLILSLNNSQW